jgi:hypothetical protein
MHLQSERELTFGFDVQRQAQAARAVPQVSSLLPLIPSTRHDGAVHPAAWLT